MGAFVLIQPLKSAQAHKTVMILIHPGYIIAGEHLVVTNIGNTQVEPQTPVIKTNNKFGEYMH